MKADNPDLAAKAPYAPRLIGMSGHAATFGLADWLCLAAAPTFAIMALLTAAYGGPDMMCSTTPGASMLSGMVPMYLLMAAFHLAPWLRLVSKRRSGARY